MLCFTTQIKVGTLCVKDHQVLMLEHRLGLKILKNLKRNIFVLKKLLLFSSAELFKCRLVRRRRRRRRQRQL